MEIEESNEEEARKRKCENDRARDQLVNLRQVPESGFRGPAGLLKTL